MATSASEQDTSNPKFHMLTPATYLEQKTMDSASIVDKSKQNLIHRRVLRAAKTRAFKTYEGFSQEHANRLAPSNCFVRLRISKTKLEHVNVPITRTKWEERVAQQKINVISRSTGEQHASYELGASLAVKNEVINHGELSEKPEENNRPDKTSEDISKEPERPDRTDDEPSCPFSTSLEPDCTQLITPNSELLSSKCLVTDVTAKHFLSHSFEKPDTGSNKRTITTDSGQGTVVQVKNNSIPRIPNLSQDLGGRVLKSITENEFQLNKETAEEVLVPVTRAKRKASCDPPYAEPRTTYRESDCLFKQQFHTLDTEPSPVNAINTGQTHVDDKFYLLNSEYLDCIGASTFKLKKIEPHSPHQSNGYREDSKFPENPYSTSDMAPVRDPNNVDSSLKDAIQKLYEVQSQVHGFVPETQPLLIDKMTELAHSLSHLQHITSPTLSPNNPIHKNRIAPEVIDYVDDSRNPDIYNREFIELVQRGNAVMNGKQQAFRDFGEIFARALKDGMPELSGQVDKVMQNAKVGARSSSKIRDDGANGAERSNGKGDG